MSVIEQPSAPPNSVSAQDAPWWRQAVVYQIYPRSFADTNADGLGDISGVTSKADYLEKLGIDAVWLSPFYPSELADGGYDVADYRDVDPRLGTLDDFTEMVKALHARDIKVVVDIVPNHTSDQHVWFQEALAARRGSTARERYIFRDGKGPGGSEAPTDWESMFGGPAWTRVTDGQWYLHTFATEQPDLNWAHREVRDDFLKTLHFWSDRGVDGFRVDVAHGLTKDLTEPLPSRAELERMPFDGNHPLVDRDDVQEVYAEWRKVFDSYDPPRTAVAEAWVAKARVPLYASPEGLGQAFNFDLLQADFDAGQFETVVRENLELARASGSSSTWVLSNHDVTRHPTRYGLPHPARDANGEPSVKHGLDWILSRGISPELDWVGGERRARAATLFMLGLPGSSYLYQGEELGLHEVAALPDSDRQDPTYFRSDGADLGRDGCRVPLPWTSSPESAFGFGDGGAHLAQPDWFARYSVEAEDGDPQSFLELYRRALALRRTLQAEEDLEWIPTGNPDVLRFRRPNGWEVVTNFGVEPHEVGSGEMLIASVEIVDGFLPAESTLWLRP